MYQRYKWDMHESQVRAPCVTNGQFFIFLLRSIMDYQTILPTLALHHVALQCAPSIPLITAPIYGYMHSWHSIALRRTEYR